MYVDDILEKSLRLENHLAHLFEMFDVLRRYGMNLNLNEYAFGVSNNFLGFMVNQRGIEANLDKIRAIFKMEAPWIVKEAQQLTGKVVVFNHFVSKVIDKCLPFFKILKKAFSFEWTSKCEEVLVLLKEHSS